MSPPLPPLDFHKENFGPILSSGDALGLGEAGFTLGVDLSSPLPPCIFALASLAPADIAVTGGVEALRPLTTAACDFCLAAASSRPRPEFLGRVLGPEGVDLVLGLTLGRVLGPEEGVSALGLTLGRVLGPEDSVLAVGLALGRADVLTVSLGAVRSEAKAAIIVLPFLSV